MMTAWLAAVAAVMVWSVSPSRRVDTPAAPAHTSSPVWLTSSSAACSQAGAVPSQWSLDTRQLAASTPTSARLTICNGKLEWRTGELLLTSTQPALCRPGGGWRDCEVLGRGIP